MTTDPIATTIAADLRARVLAFIAGSSGEDFDGLALAVHAYQYRVNPAYRRYCTRVAGTRPRGWREIPAVPADAFRDSVLACAPAARIYRSSGTTAGPERRAQHHVCDVEVYEASALIGFRRAVLAAGERCRFLVAAPERATHPASSLGEMVSWLRAAHDTDAVPSFLDGGSVDVERFATTLDALDGREPVLVLAVTSALLRLVDWADTRSRRWRLPAGSTIVDTGGCKGYPTDVSRAAVLERYRRVFGVADDQVVNEYGMTELCSQFYARGAAPHQAPPWVRTLVCDPTTGAEVAAGEIGCLRHVDLANLGSVLAIQTEDLGRATNHGFELLGRAPTAEARGCSLLVATP
jgi:hypothetical protein